MEFIYEHLQNNCLLDILKNEEVAQSLAYMVDFNEHQNLKITPKDFHIEIANADVTIAVLLYVGFEGKEYEELQTKPNFHLVSFDQVSETMVEFEGIKIKYINKSALFFMALSRSEDEKVKALSSVLLIGNYKA